MGWHAQPTAQVILEGVRVPADAMLGGADGEGAGFGIAMKGLNGGRLNIAACSLGGAQSAFDKAGSYVRERHPEHVRMRAARPRIAHTHGPGLEFIVLDIGTHPQRQARAAGPAQRRAVNDAE